MVVVVECCVLTSQASPVSQCQVLEFQPQPPQLYLPAVVAVGERKKFGNTFGYRHADSGCCSSWPGTVVSSDFTSALGPSSSVSNAITVVAGCYWYLRHSSILFWPRHAIVAVHALNISFASASAATAALLSQSLLLSYAGPRAFQRHPAPDLQRCRLRSHLPFLSDPDDTVGKVAAVGNGLDGRGSC